MSFKISKIMAKKKKSKKTQYIILGVLVLLIVLFVVGKKTGVIGKIPAEIVEVEAPASRQIVEMITASGRVQPVIEVKISPDVSGEIVELPVKEGDIIDRGILLLKIKPDIYLSGQERSAATLNSYKSQLEQTKAGLVKAEATYKRQKMLLEQKAIPMAEFEVAESDYRSFQAQVKTAEFNIKSAEASLKEADENLYKTTIYAPVSGTISKLSVELGERVVGTAQMAGTEMLRIADLSQMEVRADVNENDIIRVEMGDTATVAVDAYPDKVFKGVVTRIANSAQGTGTTTTTQSSDQITNFEVRIFILPESYADILSENPTPFRPGMSATVDIQTEVKTAMSIPIQAITTRNVGGEKKIIVFKYQADSTLVHQAEVKTGIQDKKYIEVVSGITENDKIVIAPFNAISRKLQEGTKAETAAEKTGKTDKTETKIEK